MTLPLEGRWNVIPARSTHVAAFVLAGVTEVQVSTSASTYTQITHNGPSRYTWSIEPGLVSADKRLIGGRISTNGTPEYGFVIAKWDEESTKKIVAMIYCLKIFGGENDPGTWEADETGLPEKPEEDGSRNVRSRRNRAARMT